MQPLLIVHGIDKAANLPLGIIIGLVLIERDLLPLKRFEAALGLRIVVGVAFGRHARLCIDTGEPFTVSGAGKLNPTIGVMNQPGRRLTQGNGLVACSERELRVDGACALPADTAA